MQNMAQIVEIPRIADSNQDISGSHLQGFSADCVTAVYTELFVMLGSTYRALVRHVLGDAEDAEKYRTEDHAGHRCRRLREEIRQRRQEQDDRDDCEAVR